MNSKPSIYGLTLDALSGWLTEHGEKKSRASHIWEALYTARATEFEQMTAVNAACLDLLREHFSLNTMTEFVKQEASDGTVKFLLQLHDGSLIETVLMRKKYGLSVCVTTQVGCNIGCSFCASGLIKKSRDLTAGEVVEQIMTVQRYLDAAGSGDKVTNIVVMGIGEPFDNFEHLINFLEIVKDRKGLAIAAKRITVSTSGIPDKIRAFADLGTQTHLAISLHAPNNELRTRIMKINRAFPIEKLMDAVRYYLDTTGRRIMFEYILLSEVNDGRETAAELADLLDEFKELASINLIPYNPVDEHSQYQRSTAEAIDGFYDVLKKRGINATVRMEHGTDIDAACGQLRSKQMKNEGTAVS
ncbi:23S rRNA (adenine(2503)-C(2))-methyltransferase RlmN [Saccharibacillus sp. CPCC 101409]|uniref:23S rRNA (adenine(2503)-C(2))-methyltransferase RlmN n=1 Tax=Saccharibacillus sp. CPCC 101409 TaxID=3058041 RepID=UPI002671C236|nr:23S rRNA (adenine(2503)-C(2))-methyltransferase RlmN [Saccharibacillus sp. CPCC 101409]MDO3409949.1 23S rRNA (adenine(2503)-C(2))-methyltransferase RlmN [Saccharibacillus sp. CPCC 101409]